MLYHPWMSIDKLKLGEQKKKQLSRGITEGRNIVVVAAVWNTRTTKNSIKAEKERSSPMRHGQEMNYHLKFFINPFIGHQNINISTAMHYITHFIEFSLQLFFSPQKPNKSQNRRGNITGIVNS